MSAERKCVHGTPADYQCLYHKEPMCPQCRFAELHASCPKDTLGITDEFPPPGTERGNCYDRCIENYRSARHLQIKCCDLQQKSPVPQRDSLDTLFKEFKSKVNILQEETEKCIDESKTICLRKCASIQSVSADVLTEVGKQMKTLCENTQDVKHIHRATEDYTKVIDAKRKELDQYDLNYFLTVHLARLFDPDRIVPFQQAILSSQLIDSIYPPEVHPNLNLTLSLDTRVLLEKKADISGCIVLRDGVIALVDRMNSSIKLLAADGLIKSQMKVDNSPFDITESDQGFYVSLPDIWQICTIAITSGNNVEQRNVIDTRGKCFGVEYGGQRLVVSCHLSGYIYGYKYRLIGPQTWQFCVYDNDNELLQVIEKDKLGRSFYMSQGYFNFCPFRNQILFLANDGKVEQFHITGPSSLENLGHLGSTDGEKITALTSCGSTIITCHTKSVLFGSSTSMLRLQSSIPTAISNANVNIGFQGLMCCNIRSKVLVVCERYQRNKETVFIYTF
ncbi:uncharacterized protein LOC125670067 [Ostrea edulis]|uniref:uncharacterized protein LOC125670067 n=1 Tax=Ostrea edulis TaxID=37623 RepID=UPI0024AF11A5|nr:uncharacterized protein LOC125670067 [Ostrea edulis]XP_056018233.1 uncharacterized protein LOC125670067 [Ostrea edulis]XP_056018234.1 uncharacterized protein LOC125670067 [Ostrea edulis]XP_056018235.1 uncharacterized protein LOC125670067 [Ostrea edulis]XP_056018236.1 uncharacterized protein LOC125670067 [Ostrea edulis]